MPEVAEKCIKLLKMYMENLVKDPTNEKFKKLKKGGVVFKERVASVKGAIIFLKAVGFEDTGDFFELTKVDLELIKAAIALLK